MSAIKNFVSGLTGRRQQGAGQNAVSTMPPQPIPTVVSTPPILNLFDEAEAYVYGLVRGRTYQNLRKENPQYDEISDARVLKQRFKTDPELRKDLLNVSIDSFEYDSIMFLIEVMLSGNTSFEAQRRIYEKYVRQEDAPFATNLDTAIRRKITEAMGELWAPDSVRTRGRPLQTAGK